MYLLKFSRYDCPGCDKKWYFDTIGELETFIKDAYPKFPETEWPQGRGFYPNGLSIYECVGRNPVLKMRSMVDSNDFEYYEPMCLSTKVEFVSQLIYRLQGIVDSMEDGEYQWPLDKVVPRVDKEDLIKAVFHPDRIERMGGLEWLEAV
jgi:hypothetical protein